MGMSFVTITDHNEIAGSVLLKEKYPDKVFTGVEVTTYFPDSGCKIHVLVYGLTEAQFTMISKIRSDVYELRDYLKEQDLAHSVAHATYSINDKLTLENLERLFLLFDYFEGINGSRSRNGNEILMDALSALTPEKVDDLYSRHRIEPYSETPWIKGLTGGTDDHSGLFIGKTYTHTTGTTPESFIEQLKLKQSSPGGRHNDFQGLAFAVYKIAYDFSKTRSKALSSSLFSSINQLILEQKSMDLKNKLILKKMKLSRRKNESPTKRLLLDLIDSFNKNKDISIDAKVSLVYNKLSECADHLFKTCIAGAEHDIEQGDIIALIERVTRYIPCVFLALPFFTTINVLHESRTILNDLVKQYGSKKQLKKRRILWFTDTVKDVAREQSTLKDMGLLNPGDNHDLVVITSFVSSEGEPAGGQNLIVLPPIHTYNPASFSGFPLRFPSILTSLKIICEAYPDEIFISTPGPVGLLGLLASRVLHVRCTSIYHPDLNLQELENDGLGGCIEGFLRWFYSLTDITAVQSEDDMCMLEKQGYDRNRMVAFTNTDQLNATQPDKSIIACSEPSLLVNYS